MQSKVAPRARRVHGSQIKSKVLAECAQPGASVAAVALAHGLNANVVHKWRRGQGLQRTGLNVEAPAREVARAAQATAVSFVPLSMLVPVPDSGEAAVQPHRGAQPVDAAVIEVELCGRAGQMTVRWPATQAAQCTQWLRELSTAVLLGADVGTS